jgi:hypothetical protein
MSDKIYAVSKGTKEAYTCISVNSDSIEPHSLIQNYVLTDEQ